MEKNNLFLIVLAFAMLGMGSCQKKNQEREKPEVGEQVIPDEPAYSQAQQKLFDELKAKDSLLFKLGYDQCDTATLNILISDDLEFYHDQSGVTTSKADFLQGISGLCRMSYKATRELVANSLQVFPLFNNGELYGAIQFGEHEFYGEEEGKPKYLTSTAKFSHLWILEEGDWRLKRVLSYDHHSPGN